MFVKMFSLFVLSLLLMFGARKGMIKEDSNVDPDPDSDQYPDHDQDPDPVIPSRVYTECGDNMQPLSDNPNNEGRVAGRQFPWMAAIYMKMPYKNWMCFCSGALISPHIVLTAAQCVTPTFGDKIEPENIKIGLGKQNNNFDSNETGSIIADVREIVVHQNYRGLNSNFASDVALLDLAVSVKPTPYITPARLLWEATTNMNLDGKGYIAGWTETENDSQPHVIGLSQMSLFNQSTCEPEVPYLGFIEFLTEDKMCAEQICGKKFDMAFAGASLTSVNQGIHYVVGVLSLRGTSTLYTVTDLRNQGHVNWLRSQKNRLNTLH